MQSSKLLVASLSCPELGTAQPQLVIIVVVNALLVVTYHIIFSCVQ